ncbi:IS66 family insertion sequence element accessory protein TnpA [Effusibacillus pohliae]|uniref:IS66 family insertion sequence element accessory protein TnpA n=1 Tax=Effusibacillus pohliae TaxID=232270 RepID=UPI0009FCA908
MTQTELRELWSTRIKDYRASGERVATWCERHGVTPRQLWYWLRKLKKTEQHPESSRLRWIPVHVDETSSDGTSGPSSLLVKVGSATIEVRPGFDPALFADVVRTLRSLC